MSFTIQCNQCGNKQELKDMLNNPNIIIDIANENYNDPDYDYIIITCQSCNSTYEY